MVAHSAITHWVQGALAKWYRGGLDPRAQRDPRTGDLVLRYSTRYRVAQCIISAFLGVVFVLGFLVYDIPSKLHPVKAAFLTVGWAGIVGLIIVLLIQTFGSRWTISPVGIRAAVYGWFRNEVLWSDVSEAYVDQNSRELVFVTARGKSLKLELSVDGLADLALVLKSGAFPSAFLTVADEILEYPESKRPNRAPEPMPGSGTPRDRSKKPKTFLL